MNHVKCISSCSVCLWIHSNQQKNWCFFYFCNKQSYTLNIVYFSCFAYKVCNPVSPKTPFAMYQQKGVTLCSNQKWKSYQFILKIVFWTQSLPNYCPYLGITHLFWLYCILLLSSMYNSFQTKLFAFPYINYSVTNEYKGEHLFHDWVKVQILKLGFSAGFWMCTWIY